MGSSFHPLPLQIEARIFLHILWKVTIGEGGEVAHEAFAIVELVARGEEVGLGVFENHAHSRAFGGGGVGLACVDFKEISPIFLGGVVDGLDGSEDDAIARRAKEIRIFFFKEGQLGPKQEGRKKKRKIFHENPCQNRSQNGLL